MREKLVKSIYLQFAFFTLVGVFFFLGCQSFSAQSQTEQGVSPTPNSKVMKKNRKLGTCKK